MKEQIKNLCSSVTTNVRKKLSDKKGISELVVVCIIIVIAIILAVVIFFPQISEWFKDVFMSGITDKTNELFNYTP